MINLSGVGLADESCVVEGVVKELVGVGHGLMGVLLAEETN